MYSFPNATRFAVALLLAGGLYTATQAQTTYVVTSLSDNAAQTGIDGNITLREAITAANTDAAFGDAPAGSGADIIDLTGLAGTITLEQDQFEITGALTITGPGANVLTLDGDRQYRIFDITAAVNVTISGVRFFEAQPTLFNPDGGGAVRSVASQLTLTRTEFATNTCARLSMACNGGGVLQSGGVLNVSGSTFSENTAAFGGGAAIYVSGVVSATVVGSTFTASQAFDGVIGGMSSPPISILNSTFMLNLTLSNPGPVIDTDATIYSTIISDNDSACDVFGLLVTTAGFNIIEETCGTFTPALTDQVGVRLTDVTALQNNGGSVPTILPLAGSAAVDAGDCTDANSPASDQRGLPRNVDQPQYTNTGDGCDVGAVELTSAEALPVELTRFEAVHAAGTVSLTWETATETNNAGFDIERRPAGQDAWQTLGFVPGFGTTTQAQTYRFEVDDVTAGRHEFRLKQVDFDGAFEYSPVVEVVVDLPGSYALSEVYPNPFNPTASLTLVLDREESVRIVVYDATGRHVQVLHDGTLPAQETRTFRFNAENLPSGTYLIRATGASFAATRVATLMR
ncbi:MAG: choice-of-anchor Q domain-containing protein [Bacteroidota bacterium]